MKKSLLILMLYALGILMANSVTFNVSVPAETKRCYVVGSFNGWAAGEAIEMNRTGSNTFSITLDNVSETDVSAGFKYLCGRDWAYVEKGASGEEINNRTTAGAMDIVASWANLYNPDLQETRLVVNGQPHTVKVLLPSDYETSGISYPVIYLTGVQARYDNAGSDSDRGDDHFSSASWNIPGIITEIAGGVPCIFVSMYGFVSENLPFAHPDFAGSGDSDAFIMGIENELMPYINNRFRVLTGAGNTSIVGADLGGMFSVYAALKRPDLFGQCASISPVIWSGKENLITLAVTANEVQSPLPQKFIFTVGSDEPEFLKNDVIALHEAVSSRENITSRHKIIAGASHNDEKWGEAFKVVYPYLLSDDVIEDDEGNISGPSISNTTYSIVSAIDSQTLKYDTNTQFSYIENFVYNGAEVSAQVAITEIPASVKTQYYWNVSRSADGSGEYLKSTNGNVGFSNKKTATTWHRVAVLEDETVKDVAAGSTSFRVVMSDKEVVMSVKENYKVSAIVSFDAVKEFSIYFGSVNSGSKQSALTETVRVSDECTEATILYDFYTNQVTVTETENESGDISRPNISNTTYSIVSAIDSQTLKYDTNTQFSYKENFIYNGAEVSAQVAITEIPASVKTQYYWNVSRSADGSGEYLKSTNGNIGFSNKKTATTWHRVVVMEDETVKDVAAGSTSFRVVMSDKEVVMSVKENYKVSATVSFDAVKEFSIYFGSVNSGSKQSALTETVRVSDECTEATILYDFYTNQVTVTETKWGDADDAPYVRKFIAVPSICNVGTESKVTLEIANANGCDVTIDVTHNYGVAETRTLSSIGSGQWTMDMKGLKSGIYHLSLNISKSGSIEKSVRTIAIKVLTGEDKNMILSQNPYSGIDWATINQYKSNFHTHTTQSFDANYRVDEVVDKYYNAGYKILALTDHDANPYPWELFNLYNPSAGNRDPKNLDMLAIPGNELSKSYQNSWNEVGGSEFNHHNDFFTGRQGMEFATLRESYAYTEQLGGMQLINHPGQYWSLDVSYEAGAKNSPEWHAENFTMYSSLIGLEVYNQGNRRPNDRILWDQILEISMPKRPVWGYSCDDSHNQEQMFRNYNWMLMPELTIDALKVAMLEGTHYFSYEYTGSGEGKAPRIRSIKVDEEKSTIKIETDGHDVYWISATDLNNSPSTRKSTIVGVGEEFDYSGFQGRYVRALIVNEYGETCTQPFGFEDSNVSSIEMVTTEKPAINIFPNPTSDIIQVKSNKPMQSVTIYNVMGQKVLIHKNAGEQSSLLNVSGLIPGHYVVIVSAGESVYAEKLIIQ